MELRQTGIGMMTEDDHAGPEENRRLEPGLTREQRLVQRLTVAHQVMNEVANVLDLNDFFASVVCLIAQRFGYEFVGIALVEGDYLVFKASTQDYRTHLWRHDREGNPPRFRIGQEGVTGWVAQTGQTWLVPDVSQEPRHITPPDVCVRSELAVPIKFGGTVTGVLNVESTVVNGFDEDDIQVLELLATQVATAIANARLYTDLQTAYKQLQEMQDHFVQAEKMAAIGQLVSGVAHEINNPLTGIIGYAEMLHKQPLSPQIHQQVDHIYHQGLRIARIVDNLLLFAREHKPQKACLNINQVVRAVLDLRVYDLRVSGIQVVETLRPDMPLTLGDFHQLTQVVLNIVNNAHQAMLTAHGCGRLMLATDTIVRDGITMARVTVTDDGPGIPPEYLKRIFDPFFTTKEVGQGIGLGLSIAYGLVREHGGSLSVESRVGTGTTVTLLLPVVATPFTEPQRPDLAQSGGPDPCRILVVDDDEPIRELVGLVLEAEGHQVDLVESGAAALEKLMATTYDLIITDIKMPGIDGKQLYRLIQQQWPDLARHVLFFTGDLANPETRAFLEETGNLMIGKPFDIDTFMTTMQTALRSRSRDQQ